MKEGPGVRWQRRGDVCVSAEELCAVCPVVTWWLLYDTEVPIISLEERKQRLRPAQQAREERLGGNR